VSVDLTRDEVAHVRTAARFLRARMGGWRNVAKALRLSTASAKGGASPTIAMRIARLVGVGVDDVLAGRFPDPSVCPHCGQRREEVA